MSDFCRMPDLWELMLTPEEVVTIIACVETLTAGENAEAFSAAELEALTKMRDQLTGDLDEDIPF